MSILAEGSEEEDSRGTTIRENGSEAIRALVDFGEEVDEVVELGSKRSGRATLAWRVS